MTCLRSPLPTNFRICSCSPVRNLVLKRILDEFAPSISEREIEGEKISPPQVGTWCCGGGLSGGSNCRGTLRASGSRSTSLGRVPAGGCAHVARRFMRKVPELQDWQDFLVSETFRGNISRQEVGCVWMQRGSDLSRL